MIRLSKKLNYNDGILLQAPRLFNDFRETQGLQRNETVRKEKKSGGIMSAKKSETGRKR